ncbi:MAG: hypothetical protein V1920_03400 [Bacillota bacterium]
MLCSEYAKPNMSRNTSIDLNMIRIIPILIEYFENNKYSNRAKNAYDAVVAIAAPNEE